MTTTTSFKDIYYQDEPFVHQMTRLFKWASIGSTASSGLLAAQPLATHVAPLVAVVSQIAFTHLCGVGAIALLGAYLCSSRTQPWRFTAHLFSALSGTVLAVAFLTHATLILGASLTFALVISHYIRNTEEAALPTVAGKAILNEDDNVRAWGWWHLNALVQEGKGYTEAIEAASAAAQSTNTDIQKVGLQIFIELVKKGEGYTEAVQAATNAVSAAEESVYKLGILLFVELVKQEEGYVPAIEVAKNGVVRTEAGIYQASRQLFAALFEKGEGFAAALEVAASLCDDDGTFKIGLSLLAAITEAAQSDDDKVKALKLFIKVVTEQEKGYNEAIDVAVEAVKSEDKKVHATGLVLFRKLVGKGQAYDQALAAAVAAKEDKTPQVRAIVLRLFRKLVETGDEHDDALNIAEETSLDDTVCVARLKLCDALVKKGEGYDQALAALEEAIQITDDTSCQTLREELTAQGYSTEESLALAASKAANGDIRIVGLRVLEKLVETATNLPAFVDAASCALNSEVLDYQIQGFRIFACLFRGNTGFPEALAAAQLIAARDESEGQFIGLRMFRELVNWQQPYATAAEVAARLVERENFRVQQASLELFVALVCTDASVVEAAEQAVEGKESSLDNGVKGAAKELQRAIAASKGGGLAKFQSPLIKKFSRDTPEMGDLRTRLFEDDQ